MVINIILNIFLIRSLGVWGAALASSLSTLLLFILNLKEVIKLISQKFINRKSLFMTIISSLVMFLSVYYLKQIIYWPFTIITGTIVYFMLMFFSKTLVFSE